MNCTEKAVVRCSIYQYNMEEDFKPHPHRLIMKKGRNEEDDPHDIPVGPDEGFTATLVSILERVTRAILLHIITYKTSGSLQIILVQDSN